MFQKFLLHECNRLQHIFGKKILMVYNNCSLNKFIGIRIFYKCSFPNYERRNYV